MLSGSVKQAPDAIDPWLLENLACPVDGSSLRLEDGTLISAAGRRYPVIEGVPIMLVPGERQTINLAETSLAAASPPDSDRLARYYIETVGCTPEQRLQLAELLRSGQGKLDPVALMLFGATSGYAYHHLVGSKSLEQYPFPKISLPPAEGARLLDIGCSWGRWSVAANRKGYRVVGLDPSLGAVLAARRIARDQGIDNIYIVGDGRRPPFKDACFDAAFSYSVLQHFSEDDARQALASVNRVLRPGGLVKIQMAARFGLRSLQHQLARRFRKPVAFEVRYWTPGGLKRAFEAEIGPTKVSVDCYFGLGWQWSDYNYMPAKYKPILIASELLRRLSTVLPPLLYVADSLFMTARKPG